MAKIEITKIDRLDEVEALRNNVCFTVHFRFELGDDLKGEDIAQIRVNRDVLEDALSPFKHFILTNDEARYIRQKIDIDAESLPTVVFERSANGKDWVATEYPFKP